MLTLASNWLPVAAGLELVRASVGFYVGELNSICLDCKLSSLEFQCRESGKKKSTLVIHGSCIL